MSYKSCKYITTKRIEDQQLPVICVVTASVFLIFTLPFASTRFSLGYLPIWGNYFLIWNSGMNSVI